MQTIHKNFFKLPTNILKFDLKGNELPVLVYLFYLSDNEIIHPSKQTIADKLGLSRRTVDKAISSLVKKGFVEYNRGFVKDTRKVCNQYRIRIENFAPECLEKSSKQVDRENHNEEECMEMIRKSVFGEDVENNT
jgi:DNA-binding transcriptional regulator YhcF (GntR family)